MQTKHILENLHFVDLQPSQEIISPNKYYLLHKTCESSRRNSQVIKHFFREMWDTQFILVVTLGKSLQELFSEVVYLHILT